VLASWGTTSTRASCSTGTRVLATSIIGCLIDLAVAQPSLDSRSADSSAMMADLLDLAADLLADLAAAQGRTMDEVAVSALGAVQQEALPLDLYRAAEALLLAKVMARSDPRLLDSILSRDDRRGLVPPMWHIVVAVALRSPHGQRRGLLESLLDRACRRTEGLADAADRPIKEFLPERWAQLALHDLGNGA